MKTSGWKHGAEHGPHSFLELVFNYQGLKIIDISRVDCSLIDICCTHGIHLLDYIIMRNITDFPSCWSVGVLVWRMVRLHHSHSNVSGEMWWWWWWWSGGIMPLCTSSVANTVQSQVNHFLPGCGGLAWHTITHQTSQQQPDITII